MDLDDVLEDLWEDATTRAREVRQGFGRKRRLPGLRRRVRTATMYASAGWVTVFGGAGISAELLLADPFDTALALMLGGIALPAVGTGWWAWRGHRRDAVLEREAVATRQAKQERSELPADVVGDWVRLRQAQALVDDLAREGLVAERAVGETGEMVDQLRVLLVADRRASGLGADPSRALRVQVAEVADLLVALAAEAVHNRSSEVERSAGPANLVDARERLVLLRDARAEVEAVEHGRGADEAAAWVEQESTRRDPGATADREPPTERRQQPG